MGDAITVMEHTGMARRVPPRPHPLPVHYGTSGEEYADWLDAVDRGDSTPPSPPSRLPRPIPSSIQWLPYLDAARSHGGVRVH